MTQKLRDPRYVELKKIAVQFISNTPKFSRERTQARKVVRDDAYGVPQSTLDGWEAQFGSEISQEPISYAEMLSAGKRFRALMDDLERKQEQLIKNQLQSDRE